MRTISKPVRRRDDHAGQQIIRVCVVEGFTRGKQWRPVEHKLHHVPRIKAARSIVLAELFLQVILKSRIRIENTIHDATAVMQTRCA